MPRSTALAGGLTTMLALWILLFNVYMDYENGPLPVSRNPEDNPVVMRPLPEERVENIDEAVALIPDDAKVSASNWIGPHLAHRRYLYLFPDLGDADYVIVDETEPAYDTYVNPVLNLQSTGRLRENPDYRKIFDRNGVLVFEKTG